MHRLCNALGCMGIGVIRDSLFTVPGHPGVQDRILKKSAGVRHPLRFIQRQDVAIDLVLDDLSCHTGCRGDQYGHTSSTRLIGHHAPRIP